MPITQNRFIEVLNAADQILSSHSLILEIHRQSSTTISRANSVAERSPDPIAREVMKEILGVITTMHSIIGETAQQNTDFIVTIRTEKNHFAKKKRSNDKAAYYQRQKRMQNRGELPQDQYQEPFIFVENNENQNDPYANAEPAGRETKASLPLSSDLQAIANTLTPEQIRAWYSGPNAPTPPPEYNPETGQFDKPVPERSESTSTQKPIQEPLGNESNNTIPRKGKDGITRYLPDDNELNQVLPAPTKVL